jgi:hypothetical protein
MSVAGNALPVKMRWSIHALQKLRGERTIEEFAALLDTSVELVIAWENSSIKPDEKYAARLTDLTRSEPLRDNWKLEGSGILHVDLEEESKRQNEELKQILADRDRRLLES